MLSSEITIKVCSYVIRLQHLTSLLCFSTLHRFSQQCCYDAGGLLVTGAPGGGSVALVSPDINLPEHFQKDVFPYLLCCKAGTFSNCGEYYSRRPSDRGLLRPAPPTATRNKRFLYVSTSESYTYTYSYAAYYGDPHIMTHDGYKYTFNGKGEFVLIETMQDILTLQARMLPINNSFGDDPRATVYTALVAKQNVSDTVQFEVAGNKTIVLINGEQVSFTEIKEQEFNNVTVCDLGNSSFSAAFSLGSYLEVREENGFFSSLTVIIPDTYRQVNTRGLMGSLNNNASDDLLPRGAVHPLPLNTSTEEIHKSFGLTCKCTKCHM